MKAMSSRFTDCKVNKRPLNRQPQTTSPSSRIIYVGTNTSFVAIVKRVRKALETSPSGVRGQSTRGLPLTARVAALSAGSAKAKGDSASEGDEILVRGAGRAIAKTLHIAAFFTRERDCRVSLRTLTEGAVDDIVMDDAESEGGFAAEESRVRMVSVLEVGVRLI